MNPALLNLRELLAQAGDQPLRAAVRGQIEGLVKKESRAGKPYYECRLVDAEERLVLRAWNDTPAFERFAGLASEVFVEVTGDWVFNSGFNQVEPRGDWFLRELEDGEIETLLAGEGVLAEQQAKDYAFIEQSIAALQDPRLRALGQAFLDRYGTRFKRTGAARDYHHARRGGLVEHVAQMMRGASAIAEAYPELNRDLLISGVLFHDIGKLWENAYAERGFTMPYGELGELVSHIPLGMEIVNQLWRELVEANPEMAASWETAQPDSDRVRMHLLHLIASHHGEIAFGSPVVPKTPEAFALHYVDNLDAKMEMFRRGYQVAGELGKNVQERIRPLPGRLVRPLERFVGGVASEVAPAGEETVGLEDEGPVEPGEPEGEP